MSEPKRCAQCGAIKPTINGWIRRRGIDRSAAWVRPIWIYLCGFDCEAAYRREKGFWTPPKRYNRHTR